MDDVLELLIEALDTVDGQRNSAHHIRHYIHKKKYKCELRRQKQLAQL